MTKAEKLTKIDEILDTQNDGENGDTVHTVIRLQAIMALMMTPEQCHILFDGTDKKTYNNDDHINELHLMIDILCNEDTTLRSTKPELIDLYCSRCNTITSHRPNGSTSYTRKDGTIHKMKISICDRCNRRRTD